jgi:cytochrome P450
VSDRQAEGPLYPFGRDVVQCPYAHMAELRETQPVYHVGDLPFYMVTTYADVEAVIADPETWSSTREYAPYAAIDSISSAPDLKAIYDELPDTYGTLTFADDPAHAWQRKTVADWFTPRAIRTNWQPLIDRLVGELLSQFEDKGSFDMMKDFSIPLPCMVIAEILGFDRDRVPDLKRWSDAFLRAPAGASNKEAWLKRAREHVECVRYLDDEIADRLARPEQRDLLGVMVKKTVEGGNVGGDPTLSLDEVRSMAHGMLVGGNETTTQLIGQMTYAILNTPGLWERLRNSPDLVNKTVEEGLRFTTPAFGTFRWATHDTEIRETPIPKESVSHLVLGSANRDPEVFANPEEFDVDRPNVSKHLALGTGVHVCLGGNLARAEARTALAAMLRRLPNLKVDPDFVLDYGASLNNRALSTLPMTFDAPVLASTT